MDAQVISAVGSAAGAFATIALVFVGLNQLSGISSQIKTEGERQKMWATSQACQLYDTDPVLHAVTEKIWAHTKSGTDYADLDPVKHEIISLLNYFSSLATGVYQGLYIKDIVIDNLSLSVTKAVDKFLMQDASPVEKEGYDSLIRLYNEINKIKTEPVFKNHG